MRGRGAAIGDADADRAGVAVWSSALPIWLQWYLRPAGEFTMFTLFPWAGFVFAGGAVGALLAAARDERARASAARCDLAIAGAALIALGFYTAGAAVDLPASVVLDQLADVVRDPPRDPDDRAVGVIYAWPPFAERRVAASRWQAPLARLGRSSLFVYWIHVELVYGYASWLLARPAAALGQRGRLHSLHSAALMYGAIVLRDRLRRDGASVPAEHSEPATRLEPA